MKSLKRILKRRSREFMHSTSGQSLVELAAVGSLMTLLLLGVLEFGQVVYYSIEVSNSAKAGASYGQLMSAYADDQGGIQQAALAAVPDLPPSSLQVTSSRSCVCSDGTASTCSIGDCSSSHVEATVTVNTNATISPIVKFLGFNNFTLQGQATQRCLQ